MPMLLIATKCDLLSDQEIATRVKDIKKNLEDIFNCPAGDNMILVSNNMNNNYISNNNLT